MATNTRSGGDAPPTVELVRTDIDRGRTRDKTHAGDPAAAPLGTDDEAAGAPPSLDEIRDARRRELGRRDLISDRGAGSRSKRPLGAWAFAAAAAAAVAAAFFVLQGF